LIASDMDDQEQPKSRAEVIKRIQVFTDYANYPDIMPDYSFAHIVLADFNLGDGHIKWCLEQEQIDQWVSYITEEVKKRLTNRNNEYSLNYDLAEIERVKNDTIEFLNWLLTIPENIREDGDDE